MLRSIAKTCFACAYTWGGAVRRRRGNGPAGPEPFIVCYHRVVENFARSMRGTIPSMLISTAMLERHIDWLGRRFAFASLDDIAGQLESGRPFARPFAAITFDDGYSDVYRHAYPLLKRKGVPAAMFVVSGLAGTGRPQLFDRLYLLLQLLYIHGLPLAPMVWSVLRGIGIDRTPSNLARCRDDEPFRVMTDLLNRLPQDQIERTVGALESHITIRKDFLEEMTPMTWEMVKTLHRDGFTIGSHTESHRLLTSETLETAEKELRNSKQTIERQLNAPVRHFAYPDGRFNPSIVRAVKSAGYRYGFGICRWRDESFPLLTIPRKVLWERACMNALGQFSAAVMNCQAHWAFDLNRRCEHSHLTAGEAGGNGTVD